MVTHRSAKPGTPVQFRPWPPLLAFSASAGRPALSRTDFPPKHWRRLGGFLRGRRGRASLCKAEGLCYRPDLPSAGVFPGSSVVEQPAVNRLVAGSNPARGANNFNVLIVSYTELFSAWVRQGYGRRRTRSVTTDMDIFDFITPEEVDDLPDDDPPAAYVSFVRITQRRLAEHIRELDQQEDAWREVNNARQSFMNIIIAAAKRFQIEPFASMEVPA